VVNLPVGIDDALLNVLRCREVDGAVPGKTPARAILAMRERGPVRGMDVTAAAIGAGRTNRRGKVLVPKYESTYRLNQCLRHQVSESNENGTIGSL
jgi:hypothetical protein